MFIAQLNVSHYTTSTLIPEEPVFLLSVGLRLYSISRVSSKRPRQLTNRNRFWSRFVKSLFIFFVTLILVFVFNQFFNPSLKPLIGSLSPNKTSNALQCSIRKDEDCFSWGENILVLQNPAFSGQSSWKKSCVTHWNYKVSGATNYKLGDYKQAESDFTTFVDKEICPNDPEARIYLNNSQAERTSNPVKIVVSLPISRRTQDGTHDGEGVSSSQQILRGIALAQSQINGRDGIRIGTQNRKLLVGIADDGFEGDTAAERQAAKRTAEYFSKNREIIGVIGHYSSDATKEAAKIYNQTELVVISPSSTATRKSSASEGIDLGSYVFRTASNDNIASQQLAIEASTLYRDILVIHEGTSEYSQSFKGAFQKFFRDQQGRILNNEDVDSCDISKKAGYQQRPDECLAQLNRGDVGKTALLFVPSSKNAFDVKPLIDSNSQATSPLPLLGSDSMYKLDFLEKNAKDMVVAVPWHRYEDPSDFEKEAKNIFGYENVITSQQEPFKINWETAMAYDATQAIAEGLKRAAEVGCYWQSLSGYSLSSCLRRELRNALIGKGKYNDTYGLFKADGALGKGTVTFDENGDRSKSQTDGSNNSIGVLVKVCESKDGRYDFLRIDECKTLSSR